MKKVIFEYCLNVKAAETDRLQFNILDLDETALKKISNGTIYIFFEPQRSYIILKTGIIDYLIQFKTVINEIDSGNLTPFSVSRDYYSNSLNYQYDPTTDDLFIIETNSREFVIQSKYKLFKKSFLYFYKQTMNDLLIYYPELISNPTFAKLKLL